MTTSCFRKQGGVGAITHNLVLISLIIMASITAATAQNTFFSPGNLVVSRSVYDNNPNNVAVGQLLPPNCLSTQVGCNGNAISDGTYPYVWNNNLVDSSFGVTSQLFLDQYTPAGTFINSLEVPNGGPPQQDHLVGSFSSKSEVALNLSTDGEYLTFMGYVCRSHSGRRFRQILGRHSCVPLLSIGLLRVQNGFLMLPLLLETFMARRAVGGTGKRGQYGCGTAFKLDKSGKQVSLHRLNAHS